MKRNAKGQFSRDPNNENYHGFGIWYDTKGYPIIWIDGKSIKLHVYIWELAYGNKPARMEIHHKDFNKKNYQLDNLELLCKSDHRKIHNGWIKYKNKWIKKPCTGCNQILSLDRFYPRKGYTPSALCKSCHIEATTKRRKIKCQRIV